MSASPFPTNVLNGLRIFSGSICGICFTYFENVFWKTLEALIFATTRTRKLSSRGSDGARGIRSRRFVSAPIRCRSVPPNPRSPRKSSVPTSPTFFRTKWLPSPPAVSMAAIPGRTTSPSPREPVTADPTRTSLTSSSICSSLVKMPIPMR